jgi:DNA-binding transcriptional LysR family regulator
MDRFTEIALFVRTAELASLSRAAEALDLSNAAASRHLTALEQRLGVRLIERNTRRLFLTEAGRDYHQRCRLILAEMEQADAAINAATLNPTGTLRITASISFAMRNIAPLLPEYTRRYPNVRIEIIAANRYYDLIENGIDLAIRTREYEPDSSITVRKLAETRRVLAASPGYLDRHGVPTAPADLARHTLLVYSLANHPNELRFTRAGVATTIPIAGLLTANDGQVIVAAALNGLGILVQPKYIVYDDIVAGRLVPVLDAWDLPRLTINLAYPSRAHLSAKVRTFIDFVVDQFRAQELERKWTS